MCVLAEIRPWCCSLRVPSFVSGRPGLPLTWLLSTFSSSGLQVPAERCLLRPRALLLASYSRLPLKNTFTSRLMSEVPHGAHSGEWQPYTRKGLTHLKLYVNKCAAKALFPHLHCGFPMWKTSLNSSALKKKNKNKFIYVCMYAAQANGGGSLGVLPRCAARAPRRSHVVCREPPVPPPSEGRTVLVRAGGPRGSIRAAGKVRPPRSHHAAAEGRQPYSGTDRERGGGAAAGPLRGGRWPRQGPGNPPGAAGFVCVCGDFEPRP